MTMHSDTFVEHKIWVLCFRSLLAFKILTIIETSLFPDVASVKTNKSNFKDSQWT